MNNVKRRTLLKGSLAAGVVSVAAGAGLLTPQMVLAAWPKAAFEAKGIDAAMKSLAGSGTLSGSNDIEIKAPPIAENGAVVGVTVSSKIPNAESISILVEKNGSPLACSYNLGASAETFVGTRIKVSKTSSVIAVVKAGGKLHSAGREVKVTIGGCGG